MILSAPTGIECPYCSHIIYEVYPISGNTINGKMWSDGKKYYPMWIKPLSVVKCIGCERYYFTADAKKIPSKYRNYIEYLEAEWDLENFTLKR